MMRIGCFAMRKGIFVAREAQIKKKSPAQMQMIKMIRKIFHVVFRGFRTEKIFML